MSCACKSNEPGEKKKAMATTPSRSSGFTAGHKPIRLDDLSKDAPGFGTVGVSLPPPVVGGTAAAPTINKTVDVYPVRVAASTRDPKTDADTANKIWEQCAVTINMLTGQRWKTDVLDLLEPAGVLNAFEAQSMPTKEERRLLGHHPGGKETIHAYYVPSMTRWRGSAFQQSASPTGLRAVIISDNASSDTFAHEMGHVMLDDGTHHSDPDNLMCSGRTRNVGVDKLTETQCGKI